MDGVLTDEQGERESNILIQLEHSKYTYFGPGKTTPVLKWSKHGTTSSLLYRHGLILYEDV